MTAKQSYLKRKVDRLKREIAEIDESFYELERNGDLAQHASMLERKRGDVGGWRPVMARAGSHPGRRRGPLDLPPERWP